MRSYCTKLGKQDKHTPQQLHFPSLENLEHCLKTANFKDQAIFFFFFSVKNEILSYRKQVYESVNSLLSPKNANQIKEII